MNDTTQQQNLNRNLLAFPRQHVVLASALLVCVAFIFMLIPSKPVEAKRTPIPLDVSLEVPQQTTEDVTEAIQEPEFPWHDQTVKKGDSLSRLFKRAGLSATELQNFLSAAPEAKFLKRIYPGQIISFQFDDENNWQALRYQETRLKSTEIRKTGERYEIKEFVKKPEIRHRFASAKIDNSLFLAAQKAGISQTLTMELANIFGGVIDFIYDVRQGDSFTVLYEEQYLDGEKIGNGNILAAAFVNQGEEQDAYRYEFSDGGVGYFNGEGVSMRKAFLRAPLDFTRISSNFNMHRFHPISKKFKAHRGIDYAAPTGTPVFAAGDGRVIKSGYNRANGNYVFIQHGQQYTTKYLHLHKRYVKTGQKVKQQQIIGLVGSTGYATGPHLHYEFLVNGVHRNPRTILSKLPKAESIASSEKQRFFGQTASLKMQLAKYQQASVLAFAESVQ